MSDTRTILPAELVITTFRGVRATARTFGKSPGTVSRWCRPKCEKGCDGFLPGDVQRRAWALSKELELGLSAEDLIAGRKVSV